MCVCVCVCVRAGGTSLLSQMRERLELDISAAAPGGTKVKVTAPVNPTERRYATWIGACALRRQSRADSLLVCLVSEVQHGRHRLVLQLTGCAPSPCCCLAAALLPAPHRHYRHLLQVAASWRLWARSSRCGCRSRSMTSMARAWSTASAPERWRQLTC